MSCSLRSSRTSLRRMPTSLAHASRSATPRRLLSLACFSCLLLATHPARPQQKEPALSETEVEQLRESAYIPSDRIAVFMKLLDTRAQRMTELVNKPRRPGREEDIHEMLEQFTSIADELNDNLDDYAPRHRDLRRQLPKLVEATDRWSTALRSPPEDEAYNVARRLAIESVRDIREEAVRLVADQRSFFAAHPEAAKAEKDREAGTPSNAPGESPH